MTITIDGIIFSLQKQGGISIYFHKLLAYLALQRQQSTLILESPVRQEVTGYCSEINVVRRSARILERYRSCRMPKDTKVFHSSYYRLPSDRSVPTLVTVHDFIYERFSKGSRRWVHMKQKHAAIRAAQVVICISESTRQDLLHWVGETPGQIVQVIHNGVSDTYRPIYLAPAYAPYVLYVGERGGYKNFRLVLEAMALLPDLHLHCIGGGALRLEELAVVDEPTRSRVRYLGFVTEQVLNEQYNGAVCLAYPSSYEGFGIPVIEAMRAGCPVVCTNCTAVLEVGRGALTVVTKNDPNAMADAILKTASFERASLIQKGLGVAQGYSWHATHSKTLEVYRNLVA